MRNTDREFRAPTFGGSGDGFRRVVASGLEKRAAWFSVERVTADHPPRAERPRDDAALPVDVYHELRRLAVLRMAREASAHTLQATALVHEAWLRLGARGEEAWSDREHFYAVASATMRRILIDRARRRARVRHGGERVRLHPDALRELAEPMRDEELLRIDEGLAELEKVHPERARVVVAKFFGGLTSEETAESLGLSLRSVERHWALAKVWLLRWMEREGRP